MKNIVALKIDGVNDAIKENDIKIIKMFYYSNKSIKDIAKELYTNSDYLSRVFSKTEGITIKDYILREKVELSKNMLIYHKYSFGQIALFLHFYSQSHYIKVFKKFTGMTPKQFKDIYCKK